jgi:hypothetical protein
VLDLDEHDLAGDERAGAIRSFGADLYDWALRVETPVGESCFVCKEPIMPLDVGHTMIYVAATTTRVAVHHECFLRSMGLGPENDVELRGD